MKKFTKKPEKSLHLTTETLKVLSGSQLAAVVGGAEASYSYSSKIPEPPVSMNHNVRVRRVAR